MATRAENRRAHRETIMKDIPRQTKFTCAVPACDRIVRKFNKFGVCHVHIDIIQTIQWLLQEGILKVDNKEAARSLGIWTPS